MARSSCPCCQWMHRKGKGFPVVLKFCFSLPAQPWILYKVYLGSKGHVQPQRFLLLLTSWKSWPPSEIATFLCSNSSVWNKGARGKNEDVTHVIIFHSWSVISISMCSGDAVPSPVEDSSRLARRSCLLGGRTSQEPFTFRWSQKIPRWRSSHAAMAGLLWTHPEGIPPLKISVSAPSACWPNNARTDKV